MEEDIWDGAIYSTSICHNGSNARVMINIYYVVAGKSRMTIIRGADIITAIAIMYITRIFKL